VAGGGVILPRPLFFQPPQLPPSTNQNKFQSSGHSRARIFTPSPRLCGERVGVRGLLPTLNATQCEGLSTPHYPTDRRSPNANSNKSTLQSKIEMRAARVAGQLGHPFAKPLFHRHFGQLANQSRLANLATQSLATQCQIGSKAAPRPMSLAQRLHPSAFILPNPSSVITVQQYGEPKHPNVWKQIRAGTSSERAVPNQTSVQIRAVIDALKTL